MPAPNPTRELFRRESLLQGPYGPFEDRYQIFDPMEQILYTDTEWGTTTGNEATLGNPRWALSGTNGVATDVTFDADGGVNLVTAGADNDQMIVFPRGQIGGIDSTALAGVAWNPQFQTRFAILLEVPALTLELVQAGMVLTTALDLTTDADQAKFQYSVEGATSIVNWTLAESIGGTDTETDLGVAVAADTPYLLELRYSSTGTLRAYINGILKHTSASVHTAAGALFPIFAIQALAAAAKTLKVRGVRISRVWDTV